MARKRKEKKVRRWLLRKDGKKEHYWISEEKLHKEREWDSHLRAWKLKIEKKPEEIEKEKKRREEIKRQRELKKLNQIKQTMLKLFEEKAIPHYEYYVDKDGKQRRRVIGIKGYNNMHFKRDLDRDLEAAQVQVESDGWYQLNAYTGKTVNSAEVKIKYNPKQKLLRVYIRDYELV